MKRYQFFGGKGGVGKTTAASATALFLLNTLKRKSNPPGDSSPPSILLFSTDPAHSLSDSLGVKIGNRLVQVAERKGARLVAYEMNATLALERFREAHGKVLGEIAERGTLLDEEDINELLNLSLPGLDEVMSLFELSELDRARNELDREGSKLDPVGKSTVNTAGKYAHVVVDTAPSGHTSRLLRLPEVFARMVHALDRMGEKHRYMVQHFARRRVAADEVDLFLRDLAERIKSVRNLLYDPSQTSFTLVTIPEAMSVRETQRYLALLKEQNVPVTDLIVNRVEQEHDDCVYCRARVKTQKPWLKEIEKSFGDLRLHRVPLFAEEVRGLGQLEKIGTQIWKQKK